MFYFLFSKIPALLLTSLHFTIDVHPFDVCEKLGPKYASVPFHELNKCREFYADLLRY